ncbi:hypothetical protein K8I61_02020, partial [bacterium]|nr:hypothetical protein [bacterium]
PEFGSGGGAGLDASRFTSMLTAAQYQQLISMCEQNELKIMAHPNRDEILQACGTAKMKVYSENRTAAAPLAGAMSDLESSLKSRYDQVASFDLGKSRLLSLDQVPSDIEKQEEEKRAVREMWDAIVQQHAMENFSPAVSDQIIIWAIGTPGGDDPGFVDLIIDRVFKNEGNRGRQRWLGARLRMLTDRFVEIDPAQGENDVRVQNLTLLKEWMVELQKLTYYDNSVMVGMYKYKGNRESELYGSDANTENHFRKAIYYYDEGRNRADTPKAKASLDLDIAMICSRFRSENTGTLIEFYKKGFLHARRGLRFMQVVNQVRPELGKAFYRYDEPNPEITAGLQESYGHTLTGLIYNLYLAKDYRGVISQRQYTLDAGFDWENKSEVLLIFAESAKELAAQSIHSELEYRKYKEMALAGGSRAMKFVLRQYGGKMPPPGDANFCKVFNAYWNYLDGFGQKVEAKAMENKFGATCPQ